MTVQERIVSALSHLGVPVTFHKYTGDAPVYITFFLYLEQPEQHADDRDTCVGQYAQVDVWSKSDASALVAQVSAALVDAGLRWKSSADLYEDDLKIYHTALRYVFEREKEE